MSIILDLLDTFLQSEYYYKGMKLDALGIPFIDRHKKQSVASALRKLLRKKFITKENNIVKITPSGIKYFEKRSAQLKSFERPKDSTKSKTLVILFDIPSDRKQEREWLRSHLKKFDYEMIQKSVWVGPFPLPKEFKDYLKKINLGPNIKILRLGKPYNPKTGSL